MSENECTDHPCTCENPRGAEAVVTGLPNVQLLACKLCGVLLWDIEAHYAHAHAAEVRSTDTTAHDLDRKESS